MRYKNNILEREIAHMVLNSLLYVHYLHINFVNVHKDVVTKLCIYIDAFHILSTGYLLLIYYPYVNWMKLKLREQFLELTVTVT